MVFFESYDECGCQGSDHIWRMGKNRIEQPFDAFEENGQFKCAPLLLEWRGCLKATSLNFLKCGCSLVCLKFGDRIS